MDETKWCPRCEQEVPIRDWYRNRARLDGLSAYCRSCYLAFGSEQRKRDRIELLSAFGMRCARCGYDEDWRALQLDHVDGGGRADRESTANRQGKKWARYVLAHRARFQVLCANCNQIKRMENEEHGVADHGRVPPAERIVRPSRKHSPEANAARSETMRQLASTPEWKAARSRQAKAAQARMDPATQAERSRKLSEARRGTKLSSDGHWYKPES